MPKVTLILFHLFVPPMLAELLTGNAPPSKFFNPFMFVAFVLLYGCGSLLIRELKARWNLQWSILFLGIAYAIIEEGLTTKAFFNPKWQGAGMLSGYGMYWGVQWVWALGVTFTHATLSTLIPIIISAYLWPDYRTVTILGKRGILFSIAGMLIVTVFGIVTIGTAEGARVVPFYPDPSLLVISSACVVLLCWLAYRFRNVAVSTAVLPLMHPGAFFLLAFAVPPLFLIVPNEMAKKGASGISAIVAELLLIALAVLFVFLQVYHRGAGKRHITALVFGYLMPWILLAPLHEFHPRFTPHKNGTGMLAVGAIAFVALCFWRRAVLKREA